MKYVKRFQIGKNGLTDEFVNQIRISFQKERMVKISILKSATRNKEEAKNMADELIKKLGENYRYRLIGYVLTVMRYRKPILEEE